MPVDLRNALYGERLEVESVGFLGSVGELENRRVITVDQEGLVALTARGHGGAHDAEDVARKIGRLLLRERGRWRGQDGIDGGLCHAPEGYGRQSAARSSTTGASASNAATVPGSIIKSTCV